MKLSDLLVGLFAVIILATLVPGVPAPPAYYCHICWCPYGCTAQAYGACDHDLFNLVSAQASCTEEIDCSIQCYQSCMYFWNSNACCTIAGTCSDNLARCVKNTCPSSTATGGFPIGIPIGGGLLNVSSENGGGNGVAPASMYSDNAISSASDDEPGHLASLPEWMLNYTRNGILPTLVVLS